MRLESAAYLWDADQAATAVDTFVAGKTQSEFVDDLLLRSAVERQIEILGEASGRLRARDPDTAARVPDIGRIIGMRNVIAHEYGDIDYEILWVAVKHRIPEVLTTVGVLLQEAGPATKERET